MCAQHIAAWCVQVSKASSEGSVSGREASEAEAEAEARARASADHAGAAAKAAALKEAQEAANKRRPGRQRGSICALAEDEGAVKKKREQWNEIIDKETEAAVATPRGTEEGTPRGTPRNPAKTFLSQVAHWHRSLGTHEEDSETHERVSAVGKKIQWAKSHSFSMIRSGRGSINIVTTPRLSKDDSMASSAASSRPNLMRLGSSVDPKRSISLGRAT